MANATIELNAVFALQQFIKGMTAAHGGNVSFTAPNPQSQIPASPLGRDEVVRVFLKLHPEYEAYEDKLKAVGTKEIHLCDEKWKAAKILAGVE